MIAAIMAEYGQDIDLSFLAFVLGKKMQALIRMDEETSEALKKLIQISKDTEMDINDILTDAFNSYLDAEQELREEASDE